MEYFFNNVGQNNWNRSFSLPEQEALHCNEIGSKTDVPGQVCWKNQIFNFVFDRTWYLNSSCYLKVGSTTVAQIVARLTLVVYGIKASDIWRAGERRWCSGSFSWGRSGRQRCGRCGRLCKSMKNLSWFHSLKSTKLKRNRSPHPSKKRYTAMWSDQRRMFPDMSVENKSKDILCWLDEIDRFLPYLEIGSATDAEVVARLAFLVHWVSTIDWRASEGRCCRGSFSRGGRCRFCWSIEVLIGQESFDTKVHLSNEISPEQEVLHCDVKGSNTEAPGHVYCNRETAFLVQVAHYQLLVDNNGWYPYLLGVSIFWDFSIVCGVCLWS